MLVFRSWAYKSKIRPWCKGDFGTLQAIQTRSSVLEGYLLVLEGYLQDGHIEPKKPPSAYWKACVQKILSYRESHENLNVLYVIDLNDEIKRA